MKKHGTHIQCHADGFIDGLRARRLSTATLKVRRNGVDRFLKYLGDRTLQDVTAEDFEHYRLEMIEQQFSIHTIAQYLNTARQFFAYLESENLLFINPAATMIIAKTQRRLGQVLSQAQVNRLLAIPELSRPVGLRDRAILEVLYSTGVRLGELAAMSLHDIDLSEQTVRVVGKGRKERFLPLGHHAADYLKKYLKHGRPKLVKKLDCDALWLAFPSGERIADDGIGQRLTILGREAQLPFRLSAHVFRRSCATELLRNGAAPEVVRMILGHTSMKTLAQYLSISIYDIRDMHRKSKPGR